MTIPLSIGKNSIGEEQFINLIEVPFLMISYSNEQQLTKIFKQVCSIEYDFRDKNYVITNSKRLTAWNCSLAENFVFLKDEPEMGKSHSRNELLNQVVIEINQRKKILKGKKIKLFNKYQELNRWNKKKLTYQILLIDDIWDIVKSKPISISYTLIWIFLYGPEVGVHSIIASGISYRNLLQQLIVLNPKIRKELQNKYGIPEPAQIGMLGEEIIITPDDLVYHKKKSMADMVRYFKN